MTLKEQAEEFLAQKRIAVVGVSREKDAVSNLIYRRLRDRGYEAFAVNPNMGTFDGAPCYPTLKAIPGKVDGAVIITRPEVTEQVVKDAAEAGIRHLWMHGNPMMGGSSVSAAAVEYCQKNGITVIPGACPAMFGVTADFGHKCMRWMLGAMGRLPK